MNRLTIPPNLTELAYQNIKQAILQGKLSKERFTEESLSLSLGISKSPIREAFNALKNEGLIRIEPRRGAYLREFSLDEIRDLYGVREALETYAVRHCSVTPELLVACEQSIEKTVSYLKKNDKRRHVEEDTSFHRLLSSAANNKELSRMLETVQNQIWLFRIQTYHLSSNTAPDAHRRIVAALRNRDQEAAERAIREHIQHVRDSLLTHLGSKNE
jgi:DNA-binding GntR family transcriptional regulator